MRRKDREVKDLDSIILFLQKCDTIRLGFFDEAYPYVVPVSFGFEVKNGAIVFYIHGAGQGKRKSLAQKNDRICVEADSFYGYSIDDHKGICSAMYQSFIGFGSIEQCSGEEKIKGLELLMKHCGNDGLGKAYEKMIDKTDVSKITVFDFSCKKH